MCYNSRGLFQPPRGDIARAAAVHTSTPSMNHAVTSPTVAAARISTVNVYDVDDEMLNGRTAEPEARAGTRHGRSCQSTAAASMCFHARDIIERVSKD